MRKLLLLFAVAFLAGIFPARAQAQIQLFGGYSYARPSITVAGPQICPVGILPPCPPAISTDHPNLNGWELSGAFNFRHWLGAVADFGGNYGTVQGASTHFNTYLFGPQVRLPGPVSPFAHVLIGGAHESIGSNGSVIPASASAFAAAVGAGIDVSVAPFLSLRAIQLDYLVTRFGSSTQSQPRASIGLVLHF
jgi:hypothetical protein